MDASAYSCYQGQDPTGTARLSSASCKKSWWINCHKNCMWRRGLRQPTGHLTTGSEPLPGFSVSSRPEVLGFPMGFLAKGGFCWGILLGGGMSRSSSEALWVFDVMVPADGLSPGCLKIQEWGEESFVFLIFSWLVPWPPCLTQRTHYAQLWQQRIEKGDREAIFFFYHNIRSCWYIMKLIGVKFIMNELNCFFTERAIKLWDSVPQNAWGPLAQLALKGD